MKTNFFTGSTMTTAPASEIKGMPAFSTSGAMDMVAPVVVATGVVLVVVIANLIPWVAVAVVPPWRTGKYARQANAIKQR